LDGEAELRAQEVRRQTTSDGYSGFGLRDDEVELSFARLNIAVLVPMLSRRRLSFSQPPIGARTFQLRQLRWSNAGSYSLSSVSVHDRPVC
jgi:hypothetical protein